MVWEYPALVITDARDLTKNSGNPAFAHPKATTPHTRDAYCTTPHVRQNIMRDASKLFLLKEPPSADLLWLFYTQAHGNLFI